MKYLNEGSLHENPFKVMEEDVTEAAPPFIIIDEDDVDEDFELHLDAFVNSIYKYIYMHKYIYCLGRKRYKNSINASLSQKFNKRPFE